MRKNLGSIAKKAWHTAGRVFASHYCVVSISDLADDWVQGSHMCLAWKDSVGFKVRRSGWLDPRNKTKLISNCMLQGFFVGKVPVDV